MATPTYDLLASTTLTTSASSVTFSSISATGKGDLVVTINSLADSGTTNFAIRFNGTTTPYSSVIAYSDGSSAASYASSSSIDLMAFGGATTMPAIVTATVLDYSATDKHKSVLARGDRADKQASMTAGRWASTAAVTSVTIHNTTTNNYAVGSIFNLYQLVSE